MGLKYIIIGIVARFKYTVKEMKLSVNGLILLFTIDIFTSKVISGEFNCYLKKLYFGKNINLTTASFIL